MLGHYGKGETFAISVGNSWRAIPELALIALVVAFVGFGFLNVAIALMVLGIPPILTNSFVGVRQVDPDAVEAARGMGMNDFQILTRVELPLAVPTIMSGVRTGAINIIATATIAPLAGVVTLGDFIINPNVYGDEGVIAGAILVALLAIAGRAGPRRAPAAADAAGVEAGARARSGIGSRRSHAPVFGRWVPKERRLTC